MGDDGIDWLNDLEPHDLEPHSGWLIDCATLSPSWRPRLARWAAPRSAAAHHLAPLAPTPLAPCTPPQLFLLGSASAAEPAAWWAWARARAQRGWKPGTALRGAAGPSAPCCLQVSASMCVCVRVCVRVCLVGVCCACVFCMHMVKDTRCRACSAGYRCQPHHATRPDQPVKTSVNSAGLR